MNNINQDKCNYDSINGVNDMQSLVQLICHPMQGHTTTPSEVAAPAQLETLRSHTPAGRQDILGEGRQGTERREHGGRANLTANSISAALPLWPFMQLHKLSSPELYMQTHAPCLCPWNGRLQTFSKNILSSTTNEKGTTITTTKASFTVS